MTSWADYDDDEDEEFIRPLAWATSDTKYVHEREAGNPIGIKAVQYVLMSQTQMRLSHFHTAGMEQNSSSVIPSVADTMNNNYTSDNTSMKFEIDDNINTIRGNLVGTEFSKFVIKIGSSITTLPEPENVWYKILGKEIGRKQILRFYLDYKKFRMYNLTLRQIADTVFKNDCSWEISPDFMGMIDITLPSSYLHIWLGRLSTMVCGTPNILSCDYVSSTTIGTRGSDIIAVSTLNGVNKSTIYSNNVNEIEKYLGIEAATSVLDKLLNSSTISNFMTRTGKVQPFVKSSTEIARKGLLFAMGFERPKDDIRKALIDPDIYNDNRCIYTDIMEGKDPTFFDMNF